MAVYQCSEKSEYSLSDLFQPVLSFWNRCCGIHQHNIILYKFNQANESKFVVVFFVGFLVG